MQELWSLPLDVPSSGWRLDPLHDPSSSLGHTPGSFSIALSSLLLITNLQAPLSPSLKSLLSRLLIFSPNSFWTLPHPSLWKFHLSGVFDLRHGSQPWFLSIMLHIRSLTKSWLLPSIKTIQSAYWSAPPPPPPGSRAPRLKPRFCFPATSKQVFWLPFLSSYRVSFLNLGAIGICVQITLCC